MGHGRMREKEKEDAYRIMRLAAGEARVMRGQKGEAECRESMHVHIVAAGIRKGEGRREDVEKVQRDVRRRDRYAGVYGSRPYDSGPSWLSLPPTRSNSCPFLRLRLVFFLSFCYSLVYVPLMGPTRAPNPPVLPVDDSLAPRSGRVSDCVITGSHTESSRIEWSRGESSRVAGSGATPQRSMRDISHHFPFNPSEL